MARTNVNAGLASRARQAALAELVDVHLDEFNAIHDQHRKIAGLKPLAQAKAEQSAKRVDFAAGVISSMSTAERAALAARLV